VGASVGDTVGLSEGAFVGFTVGDRVAQAVQHTQAYVDVESHAIVFSPPGAAL